VYNYHLCETCTYFALTLARRRRPERTGFRRSRGDNLLRNRANPRSHRSKRGRSRIRITRNRRVGKRLLPPLPSSPLLFLVRLPKDAHTVLDKAFDLSWHRRGTTPTADSPPPAALPAFLRDPLPCRQLLSQDRQVMCEQSLLERCRQVSNLSAATMEGTRKRHLPHCHIGKGTRGLSRTRGDLPPPLARPPCNARGH
jgi:hypothetical protein